MIKQFTCKNFRNVNLDGLEFGRVNLLLGPNNAGKSNFIKALSFGANMITMKKEETETGFYAEVQRDGSFDILRKDAASNEIELKWRILLEQEEVEYRFKFHIGKSLDDLYILMESLDDVNHCGMHSRPFNFFSCHDSMGGVGYFSTARKLGEKNKRIKVPVKADETVLRQFDKLVITNSTLSDQIYIRETLFSILEDMKQFFGRFYACSSSMFDFSKVRELCEESETGKVLKRDASNFVAVYQYQCGANENFKARFLEDARMLMHDLVDIKVEKAFGKMAMSLVRGNQQYTLADVSDGTIEALIILLILSLSDEQHPTLLAIDEPEVNLHPAWQKILAKWIQNNGNFVQCFISTHSPDFLDEFTEGFAYGKVNIYVSEFSQDVTFRNVKRERITQEINEGWQLGDLYRVNDPAIGGWPW